jgi:hypothetical protein
MRGKAIRSFYDPKNVERAKVKVNMASLTVPGRASSSSLTALVLTRWLIGVNNTA